MFEGFAVAMLASNNIRVARRMGVIVTIAWLFTVNSAIPMFYMCDISATVVRFRPVVGLIFSNLELETGSGPGNWPNLRLDRREQFEVVRSSFLVPGSDRWSGPGACLEGLRRAEGKPRQAESIANKGNNQTTPNNLQTPNTPSNPHIY